MIYTKKDETILVVTKSVETKEETNEYNLDELKAQELSILKSRNDFIEERDVELAEVRGLISECVKLDIKSQLEVETIKEAELIK
jgi:hypothetical protein